MITRLISSVAIAKSVMILTQHGIDIVDERKALSDAFTCIEESIEELIFSLAEVYKDYPVAIAELVDEYIDPSGKLLGEIRELNREE